MWKNYILFLLHAQNNYVFLSKFENPWSKLLNANDISLKNVKKKLQTFF